MCKRPNSFKAKYVVSFLIPLDREKPKVVFCPRRIFKVYYGSGPVWVNMTKPVFTDNVGVVSYYPPLIDGVSTSMTRHFTFKAYDAAGNSADCKVVVYVGGKRNKALVA